MTVRNRTIAVLLGGLAGLLALPSLGHASPQPDDTVPGRSNDITLSITDSRDRIAVGEDTAYTVTVRNEGEEAAPELLVAQIAVPTASHQRASFVRQRCAIKNETATQVR